MKFCQEGNHEVPNLFWRGTKERKSACMQCARKYAKPISKGVKMIESNKPLNKPVQATKKVKPIPKVSEKQLLRLKQYKKVKEEYFKEHPICEYPFCISKNITLHHRKGRVGELLTDKRYFASLCGYHHRIIELHPEEAKELGLSLDRLTK